jgi:hypothetical protein
VQVPQLRVGDAYTADIVARLGDGVDAMGENGEFHTLMHMWEAPTSALG